MTRALVLKNFSVYCDVNVSQVQGYNSICKHVICNKTNSWLQLSETTNQNLK